MYSSKKRGLPGVGHVTARPHVWAKSSEEWDGSVEAGSGPTGRVQEPVQGQAVVMQWTKTFVFAFLLTARAATSWRHSESSPCLAGANQSPGFG